MSFTVKALGKDKAEEQTTLRPITIRRRAVGPNDVRIEILASSVCHTDSSYSRGLFGPLSGVIVPGHEMCGKVVEVGANVKDVVLGGIYGVGCMVGTNCIDTTTGQRTCSTCTTEREEVFCEKGNVNTYMSKEVLDGVEVNTLGGFSTDIVVNSHFAIPIPNFFHDKLHITSPILCAGITVYTPLKQCNVGPNSVVGVAGIGGLGIFAIKIARAMGAKRVVAFTRSAAKAAELIECGATDVVLTTDAERYAEFHNQLDCIVDTIPAPHDMTSLFMCLKMRGTLCVVGASPQPAEVNTVLMVSKALRLITTMIGSIDDTKAVLQLCADHQIIVPVEMVKPEEMEAAFDRLDKGDVHYRFAIDMQALREMNVE